MSPENKIQPSTLMAEITDECSVVQKAKINILPFAVRKVRFWPEDFGCMFGFRESSPNFVM